MAVKEDEALRIHKQLLYSTIALDFCSSDIDKGYPASKFRAKFRNHVHDDHSTNAKDVCDLIQILETKGKISVGDYSVLRDIVSFDTRIVKEIDDTERILHEKGFAVYERNNGTKRVKDKFVNNSKSNYMIFGEMTYLGRRYQLIFRIPD